MGIKLDWQVEAEVTSLRAAEDPDLKRRRRRARRRLVLLAIVISTALVVAAGLIVWRLNEVDARYERDLRDTVFAELAALRTEKPADFMAIQRSRSETFLHEQSQRYVAFRSLITDGSLDLVNARVVDVDIDRQRGRALLEVVKDGLPHRMVWFYWYYEDGDENEGQGWRHVPDDLTFWGEERVLELERVRLTYGEMDAAYAQALAPRLAAWWNRGCALLQCFDAPPTLSLTIVADRPPAVAWDLSDSWELSVTSPLLAAWTPVDDAGAPMMPEYDRAIVQQIAVRLVRHATGDTELFPYGDAAWWHDQIAGWLSEAILLGEGATVSVPGFMGTLMAQYGPGAPVAALRGLGPEATLESPLFAVTGVPLDQLSVDQLGGLDWRDFFAWRLELESLLATPNGGGVFLSLYDLDNPAMITEVRLRQESPDYAARYAPDASVQITGVTIVPDGADIKALVDLTRIEKGEIISERVEWRLIRGTWKRTN